MSNYTSKHSAGGSHSGKSGSKGDKKTQKILIIVIICVLAVIIAAALIFIFVPGAESGVSNLFGGKSDGYVPETQSVTTNITPYYNDGVLPTSSDRHDIDIIYGGGANGADLYGTWKMNDHDTYIFDGLGRGIFLAVNKDGNIDFKFTFVYSAQDGKLGIDYDGDNGEDRFYDYTIDGDTMTLTFNGNTYTLEKVEEEQ
ncbi:MAG: hypothetical protein IJH40_09120 [Ruminococcus sp.]|uniref:DUF5640 domain-containing protein n=1 Tax=Ruminococcus sp. TaxID=41978 RepID=UPI002873D109|nr:DUF5640 domain-containing protein [Ruminococcus sp.]MBQ3285784.1 hypothetical protein [Ruminococcus sp.]